MPVVPGHRAASGDMPLPFPGMPPAPSVFPPGMPPRIPAQSAPMPGGPEAPPRKIQSALTQSPDNLPSAPAFSSFSPYSPSVFHKEEAELPPQSPAPETADIPCLRAPGKINSSPHTSLAEPAALPFSAPHPSALTAA